MVVHVPNDFEDGIEKIIKTQVPDIKEVVAV